jgi:hypothetical protein
VEYATAESQLLSEKTDEDVQKTSLNGAQVASMVDIVSKVAQGLLPRESGLRILAAAFPLTEEQSDKILGAAGDGFVATQEQPPGKDSKPAVICPLILPTI